MKFTGSNLLVYAVTDKSYLNKRELYLAVSEALKGGATLIQLREKDMDEKNFIKEARIIKNLCDSFDTPLIINDNINVAIAVDAAGVHIGQNDMSIKEARSLLGPNKIIGLSTQNLLDSVIAEKNGADYLGVGAMFPTETKKDAIKVSLETLTSICSTVNIPVCAIGGINIKNINEFSETGVDGLAIVSAIFAEKDITKSTKQLKLIIEKVLN